LKSTPQRIQKSCDQPAAPALCARDADSGFTALDHALLGIAAMEFHSIFAKAINYQIFACPRALGMAILRFTVKEQIPINYQ
jgi:hypothetical protein